MRSTAAEPADTSIVPSGMVPSLLTFQIWTAKVSAWRKIEIGLVTLRMFQLDQSRAGADCPCCIDKSSSLHQRYDQRPRQHLSNTLEGFWNNDMDTVSQREIPRARPASRCVWWTCFKLSSTLRVIWGKLKTVKAKAPEIIENPYSNWNYKDQVTKETYNDWW